MLISTIVKKIKLLLYSSGGIYEDANESADQT